MTFLVTRNPWNSSSVVLSPCIGVCEMDAGGLCRGCERTLVEIGEWATLDDSERVRLMLHELPDRASARRR